jgi:hypothetical protein
VTVTTSTSTLADRLVAAMRDADWGAIVDTYAPDVLLDMNSPTWRFQLQGRDAASALVLEQANGLTNLRATGHQVFRTDDGVIIEEEMRFDGEGGEHLWRAVDIFRIDGERVVEHIQYCTGPWSPERIARQADEAPMVRW